jgi:hypothetical protein
MTPKPVWKDAVDSLIEHRILILPIDMTPRRHVWRICNDITKRGYPLPEVRWRRVRKNGLRKAVDMTVFFLKE